MLAAASAIAARAIAATAAPDVPTVIGGPASLPPGAAPPGPPRVIRPLGRARNFPTS